MAAGQQGDERFVDHAVLAEDGRADGGAGAGQALGQRRDAAFQGVAVDIAGRTFGCMIVGGGCDHDSLSLHFQDGEAAPDPDHPDPVPIPASTAALHPEATP
jgi:hypothetical protein